MSESVGPQSCSQSLSPRSSASFSLVRMKGAPLTRARMAEARKATQNKEIDIQVAALGNWETTVSLLPALEACYHKTGFLVCSQMPLGAVSAASPTGSLVANHRLPQNGADRLENVSSVAGGWQWIRTLTHLLYLFSLLPLNPIFLCSQISTHTILHSNQQTKITQVISTVAGKSSSTIFRSLPCPVSQYVSHWTCWILLNISKMYSRSLSKSNATSLFVTHHPYLKSKAVLFDESIESKEVNACSAVKAVDNKLKFDQDFEACWLAKSTR